MWRPEQVTQIILISSLLSNNARNYAENEQRTKKYFVIVTALIKDIYQKDYSKHFVMFWMFSA